MTEDECTTNEVRNLLERALAEAAPRAGGDRSQEVFAEAARVRTGRRVLGIVAVAVAAVAAMTAGTGLVPGTDSGRSTSQVAGSGKDGNGGGGSVLAPGPTTPAPSRRRWNGDPDKGKGAVDVVRRLLPASVGTVTQVKSHALDNPDSGNLDGEYSVTKGGMVGGLEFVWGEAAVGPLDCSNYRNAGQQSCVQTNLPDGRVLMITEVRAGAMKSYNGHMCQHSYVATLALGNGRVLFVSDISGYIGPHAPGPAMAAPPLTTAQLAAFAQLPDLEAGADLAGL